MAKKASILAEATVHFRTGATLNGKLHEFILCENTEAMREALSDPKFMRQIEGQEYSFINLDNVAFLNVQNIKVVLAEDIGGANNEEG